MRIAILYLIGLVFGIGISISGMINPAKVLNFFDFAGSWDPSLMFVMGGALIVAFIGYRVVLVRPAPLMAKTFQLPGKSELDARLIGGSALFGVGWGIAGFCPGGALPALGTGVPEVFAFVAAMIVGILFVKLFENISGGRAAAAKSQT